MKWLLRIIGSTVAALIITAGAVVITVIWLMFSGGSTEGRRLGYFGAVFVEVDQTAQGSTGLGVGLADPLPLAVSTAAVTLFVVAVMLVLDQLRERKKRLLAEVE